MRLAPAFFAAFAVYGVASPYLAVLIRGLGYTPALVGILLGFVEVAGIAGPFLVGRLADRTGRYRSNTYISIALVILPLWPLVSLRSPLMSALALGVLAVGLRSFVPLLDAAATISLGPGGDYGRVRAVGSISFVLAALFLQYVPFLKPERPGAIAFWLGASALAYAGVAFLLPETRQAAGTGQREHEEAQVKRPSFLNAGFVAGMLIIALGRLAMAPIASFFSLYVAEELHWNAVGLMWALAAASEIPLMFVSAALIRRFGPSRLIAVSILAIAARLAIYALFPSPPGAIAGQLLHSLCYGLFHPAAIAFVAQRVAPERRVMGMAVYLSLGMGLPTFLGSALGGFIVEWWGYRGLFGGFIGFAALGLLVFAASRGLLGPEVERGRR